MALLYSDNDDKPWDFKAALVRDFCCKKICCSGVVVCSFLLLDGNGNWPIPSTWPADHVDAVS